MSTTASGPYSILPNIAGALFQPGAALADLPHIDNGRYVRTSGSSEISTVWTMYPGSVTDEDVAARWWPACSLAEDGSDVSGDWPTLRRRNGQLLVSQQFTRTPRQPAAPFPCFG